MPVEWDRELETGIKTIDDQHKEIFRRLGALLDACKEGRGRAEVGGMLAFLEDYVVEHFTAEENIQVHYNYPEYSAHKAMHELFIKDVKGLRKQFEEEGPSLTMVLTTNKVVVEWLSRHIRRVDKMLAEFLKARGYTE